MLTVNGDGPADLDTPEMSLSRSKKDQTIGPLFFFISSINHSPDLKSRLRTESARAMLVEYVLALGAGDDWSVRGLAAAKRAVVCFYIKTHKINPVTLHYMVFYSLSFSFLEDQRESFISPSDHGSRQALSLFSFSLFSFVHFTSIPLREGGRGTAIVPRVGVLPRELGACNLPCLGGNAGTISPTSSNRSSPAQAASKSINSLSDVSVGSENVLVPGVAVLCRLEGEPVPVGDIMEPKDWPPAATVPVGVDVLEWVGLWNRLRPTRSLLDFLRNPKIDIIKG